MKLIPLLEEHIVKLLHYDEQLKLLKTLKKLEKNNDDDRKLLRENKNKIKKKISECLYSLSILVDKIEKKYENTKLSAEKEKLLQDYFVMLGDYLKKIRIKKD